MLLPCVFKNFKKSMDIFILIKIALLMSLDLPFVSACGGHFTNRYGIITSPNYTSLATTTYPPNSDCNWTISTPVGTRIVLKVLYFNLACPHDFIEVTDRSSKRLLHKKNTICDGDDLVKPLFSESNMIHIRFVSDGSQQAKGFKLVWKVKSILTWNSNFVTWPKAQTICNQNGGTLITDVADNEKEIFEHLKERFVTEIWQGQYVTPWVWLKGCFRFENLDSFKTSALLKTNQMKECVKFCSNWNYFGLRDKSCFCFDTFAGDSVVTEPNCNLPCPGNSRERCGGNGGPYFLTIYMNDICFNNSREWQGNVSRTKEGNICLPWKDIRALAGDSSFVFPDGSAEEASNYCRNPNGSQALWCYVSQDESELCDVPPCVTKDGGKSRCMAVKDNANDALEYISPSCTAQLNAVCSGIDGLHYVTVTPRSWEDQRENTRTNVGGLNCKSLVDSSIFFVDKALLLDYYQYWIGLFREYTTTRAADATGPPGSCFIVSNRDGIERTDEVADCSSKRNFICQSVPVTCGKQFDDFKNASFTTPNYPTAYDALMHCIWTIFVPDDHYMLLTLYTDIEYSPACQYDSVKIYEGASIHDDLNVTLCGKSSRSFYNIRTNMTIEFLSDETVQSFGIYVIWRFVPIKQAPTSTLVPATQPQKDNNLTKNENGVELPDGALTGLIVGIVVLLLLACLGGFLCGRRRRGRNSNDKRKSKTEKKSAKDNVDGKTVNLQTMKNQNNSYIASEQSFHNGGFEADEPPQTVGTPANKRVDYSEVEPNSTGAVYSTVNKPSKGTGTESNKLTPVGEDAKKKGNPEDLYNSLNEKAENVYANKTENIYNQFNDSEPNYDITTSSMDMKKDKNVDPDLDTYDHKK